MEEKTNEQSVGTVSRRDFVKGTAAVVGSLMASQFPLMASAYYGVDDAIKIGLIGCGGRGTGAASQALSTTANVKLYAMADAFEGRRAECYTKLMDPEQPNSWKGTNDDGERLDVPK